VSTDTLEAVVAADDDDSQTDLVSRHLKDLGDRYPAWPIIIPLTITASINGQTTTFPGVATLGMKSPIADPELVFTLDFPDAIAEADQEQWLKACQFALQRQVADLFQAALGLPGVLDLNR